MPGKKVDVDGTQYSADHIIIATGSRSRVLPNLPQDGKKSNRVQRSHDTREATKINDYCW